MTGCGDYSCEKIAFTQCFAVLTNSVRQDIEVGDDHADRRRTAKTRHVHEHTCGPFPLAVEAMRNRPQPALTTSAEPTPVCATDAANGSSCTAAGIDIPDFTDVSSLAGPRFL